MSKLCSEWTIPPHIDMRCNYFSVHGQLALRAASIMECVHDSCSIYWMWWSAIIQAYPQYQRISTFHIFVWIVYYVFGVGHERIDCSAAKDCVVDNLDYWIIVLSLRHIHMMWYAWQEWSWVTQQHTTHPTRSLFRTVRYDSFRRLHQLPVHMFVIWNIVELSILHIARWAHTSLSIA